MEEMEHDLKVMNQLITNLEKSFEESDAFFKEYEAISKKWEKVRQENKELFSNNSPSTMWSMLMDALPNVIAIGGSGDAIGTIGVKLVADCNGNIALMYFYGITGKTDFEASAGPFIETSFNMNDLYDMVGNSAFEGGGIDTAVGPGLDYTYSHGYTDDNRYVSSHSGWFTGNISTLKAEGRGGMTRTEIVRVKIPLFNIDVELKLNIFDF